MGQPRYRGCTDPRAGGPTPGLYSPPCRWSHTPPRGRGCCRGPSPPRCPQLQDTAASAAPRASAMPCLWGAGWPPWPEPQESNGILRPISQPGQFLPEAVFCSSPGERRKELHRAGAAGGLESKGGTSALRVPPAPNTGTRRGPGSSRRGSTRVPRGRARLGRGAGPCAHLPRACAGRGEMGAWI